MSFDLTETGNAELIERTSSHSKQPIQYDHSFKRWVGWDSTENRWYEDNSGAIYSYAIQAADKREKDATAELELLNDQLSRSTDKEAAKRISTAIKQANARILWAKKSKNLHNIQSSLAITATLKSIAFTGDWDADPYQFQTRNGVLYVGPTTGFQKTGSFRTAKKDDYLLKRGGCDYDPQATCTRWKQFLNEITQENEEEITFLQKAVGYSMTGRTNEELLFVLHGSGQNGKSKFIEAIYSLFGDYALDLKYSNLVAKSTELIGQGQNLPGKRFVKTDEIKENASLDTGLIKSWTGSTSITVRPFRAPEYTFTATHKLWMSFNDRPLIHDQSDATWRRLRLIPFSYRIPDNKRDNELSSKLNAELPGILNWALEGLALYYEKGLADTPKMKTAKEDYRSVTNTFEQFLADQCIIGGEGTCTQADFNREYQKWCSEQGDKPLSPQKLGDRFQQFGIKKERLNSHRFLRGVHLRGFKSEESDRIVAESDKNLSKPVTPQTTENNKVN